MNGERTEVISSGINDEQQREPFAIDQNIDVIIARAEKQVEVLKKVLKIAVSRTNNDDWLDQQGKPYLTASGAEKLMPLFGISLENATYDRKLYQDEEGNYYIYQYKGKFSWTGGSIEAIGACSSRDKFFAYDSATKSFKPLAQVDETNIMKASYSNMMMNGITRLLGIRNLTWEQLSEFGVTKDKAQRVSYGGAGKTSNDDIAKQNEISKWCLDMANQDRKEAIKILEKLTAFKGKDGKQVAGVISTKALKGIRLNIAHSTIKKTYEDHQKALGQVNGGDKK